MEFESRLIPIMRDGIEVIKMIFFLKLKASLAARYPDRDRTFILHLAGAIINQLFGSPNTAEPFASFVPEHRALIAEEMARLGSEFKEMRIPLTDALRMQTLCDHQEGSENSVILAEAKNSGILLFDRELPLPHGFLHLVHRLGKAHGLLTPPPPAE
jgi:hypothetical protein